MKDITGLRHVVFVMEGGTVYKSVSAPRGLPARGPRTARGAIPGFAGVQP